MAKMSGFIALRRIPVQKWCGKVPAATAALSPEIYRLSGLVSGLILLFGFDDQPRAQDPPRRRRQRHATLPGQGAGKRRFSGLIARQRHVGLPEAARGAVRDAA